MLNKDSAKCICNVGKSRIPGVCSLGDLNHENQHLIFAQASLSLWITGPLLFMLRMWTRDSSSSNHNWHNHNFSREPNKLFGPSDLENHPGRISQVWAAQKLLLKMQPRLLPLPISIMSPPSPLASKMAGRHLHPGPVLSTGFSLSCSRVKLGDERWLSYGHLPLELTGSHCLGGFQVLSSLAGGLCPPTIGQHTANFALVIAGKGPHWNPCHRHKGPQSQMCK